MPTAKQNQKFSFLNFRFSAGGVGGADKKWKENFWFLLPRPKGADEAREIRAYDLVSLHHARGACDIICFENRCELGTIKTPEYKLPNRPIWQLIQEDFSQAEPARRNLNQIFLLSLNRRQKLSFL